MRSYDRIFILTEEIWGSILLIERGGESFV